METYSQMMNRQQNEYQKFSDQYLIFAFTMQQLEEQKIKKGFAPNADLVNLLIPGAFIQREDLQKYKEFTQHLANEQQAAIDADTTGDGFIYQMFKYELNNHEFSYTGELGETLESVGLDLDEIHANKALLHGLTKAAQEIWPEFELTYTHDTQ